MRHDESWQFMRLGRYLERAEKAARLLEIKFHLMSPEDPAVDLHQWRALLSSASAEEVYVHADPAGLSPNAVARFLILDERFPRSVAYALGEVEDAIAELAAAGAMAARPAGPGAGPGRPGLPERGGGGPGGPLPAGAAGPHPGPLQRHRGPGVRGLLRLPPRHERRRPPSAGCSPGTELSSATPGRRGTASTRPAWCRAPARARPSSARTSRSRPRPPWPRTATGSATRCAGSRSSTPTRRWSCRPRRWSWS